MISKYITQESSKQLCFQYLNLHSSNCLFLNSNNTFTLNLATTFKHAWNAKQILWNDLVCIRFFHAISLNLTITPGMTLYVYLRSEVHQMSTIEKFSILNDPYYIVLHKLSFSSAVIYTKTQINIEYAINQSIHK